MTVLTIVEGSSYRKIADVKKIKDIPLLYHIFLYRIFSS